MGPTTSGTCGTTTSATTGVGGIVTKHHGHFTSGACAARPSMRRLRGLMGFV